MTHETTNDPAPTRTFRACALASRLFLAAYLLNRLLPMLEPPRLRRYAFLATGSLFR